jgi:hypothetical protein
MGTITEFKDRVNYNLSLSFIHRSLDYVRIFLSDQIQKIQKIADYFFCVVLRQGIREQSSLRYGEISPTVCVATSLHTAIQSVEDDATRPKKGFFIKEIAPHEYADLSSTMKKWMQIAKQKKGLTTRRDLPCGVLFRSLFVICKLISQCLDRPEKCRKVFDRVLVSYDPKKNLQAVCLTKKEAVEITNKEESGRYLKIALLVTHPHNIRSSINEQDHERMTGSATSLIKKIIRQCKEEKRKGIYAEVVPVACGFYEKLGFRKISREGLVMFEPDQIPMVRYIKSKDT